LVDVSEGDTASGYLHQDVLGGGGPDEAGAFRVVRVEIFLDLADQIRDRPEHSAADRFVGQFPEPPLLDHTLDRRVTKWRDERRDVLAESLLEGRKIPRAVDDHRCLTLIADDFVVEVTPGPSRDFG
jgi:hypothetical protein